MINLTIHLERNHHYVSYSGKPGSKVTTVDFYCLGELLLFVASAFTDHAESENFEAVVDLRFPDPPVVEQYEVEDPRLHALI